VVGGQIALLKGGERSRSLANAISVQQTDTIHEALGVVELGVRAAQAYGRPDLADRLHHTSERLSEPAIKVMVIGEFKQGKSSLVNALVGMPLCPVDE